MATLTQDHCWGSFHRQAVTVRNDKGRIYQTEDGDEKTDKQKNSYLKLYVKQTNKKQAHTLVQHFL